MNIDPDRLDELLTQEPYLNDDGFTGRVMARLPPRRRDPRRLVMGGSVAAAVAVGFVVLPPAVREALRTAAATPLPVTPLMANAAPGWLI